MECLFCSLLGVLLRVYIIYAKKKEKHKMNRRYNFLKGGSNHFLMRRIFFLTLSPNNEIRASEMTHSSPIGRYFFYFSHSEM